MDIQQSLVNGIAVLSLRGKLTLGEGDEGLKHAVNSALEQGVRRIVLDLSEVPYIDSAGLGEVVRSYTTVSRQGGKLVLVNVTKRVNDLLSITKLMTVFDIYESEAAAVKALLQAPEEFVP